MSIQERQLKYEQEQANKKAEHPATEWYNKISNMSEDDKWNFYDGLSNKTMAMLNLEQRSYLMTTNPELYRYLAYRSSKRTADYLMDLDAELLRLATIVKPAKSTRALSHLEKLLKKIESNR